MKITNTSKALQGVNTTTGIVYLRTGEGRDLELNDVEAAHVKTLPFFTVEDGATDAAVDLSQGPGPAETPDREALKAQAADLGIDFARNIPTDKLAELVAAKQAG